MQPERIDTLNGHGAETFIIRQSGVLMTNQQWNSRLKKKNEQLIKDTDQCKQKNKVCKHSLKIFIIASHHSWNQKYVTNFVSILFWVDLRLLTKAIIFFPSPRKYKLGVILDNGKESRQTRRGTCEASFRGHNPVLTDDVIQGCCAVRTRQAPNSAAARLELDSLQPVWPLPMRTLEDETPLTLSRCASSLLAARPPKPFFF